MQGSQCLRKVKKPNFVPTAPGSIYEKGFKPSWFQKFMVALDKDLVGSRNLLGVDCAGNPFERDPQATYAVIAQALSGYKKTGKART